MDGSPCEKSNADLRDEFQGIGIRARENWSFVQAFHECFSVTLPGLPNALIPYLDASVRNTMGEDFPAVSDELNMKIMRGMAAQKEKLAKSVVDAATVVLVQATLDSAVNQYLVLLAQVDPTIWEGDLKDATVRLGELECSSYSSLLARNALVFAKSLSSKSLSKKVQLILDRCGRDSIEPASTDFHFDIPRLKAFDDCRHDVAHGRGMGITISNMDEVMLFLWRTLWTLENVIAARVGFQRDPIPEIENATEPRLRNVSI
jgi:hypothetical protein